MGQTTNAIIFRLGLKNIDWKFKYFGKNIEDLGFYNYQIIELDKYLEQFAKRNNLTFYDYKIYYKLDKLKLRISYFFNFELTNIINKNITTQRLKIKKSLKNKNYYFKNYYKSFYYKSLKNQGLLLKNNYLQQFLESLKGFTSKKGNILIKFQKMNKNQYLNLQKDEKQNLKTIVFLLRKYSKNWIFQNTINLTFLMTRFKSSAKFAATSIANLITKSKKHSIFIFILKQSLPLFLKANFSRINGIKIVIKGKINKAQRAKSTTITAGTVPIQSIKFNLNYYSSAAFTANGTIGVKVWLNEK